MILPVLTPATIPHIDLSLSVCPVLLLRLSLFGAFPPFHRFLMHPLERELTFGRIVRERGPRAARCTGAHRHGSHKLRI